MRRRRHLVECFSRKLCVIVRVLKSERQPQTGFASRPLGAILERERAAVSFGDLARQHETDTGTARFSREEWNE